MLCCLLNISRSFGRIYCYLMHRLSVQRRVVLNRSVGNYRECLCRCTEYRQILQYIQSLCKKDFVRSRARIPDGVSWTFSSNGAVKIKPRASDLLLNEWHCYFNTSTFNFFHVFDRFATLYTSCWGKSPVIRERIRNTNACTKACWNC